MHPGQRALVVLTLVLASFTSTTVAQPGDRYAPAEAAARAGQLGEMERLYGELLASNANDRRALVGRGTARSWQRDWANAERDFLAALGRFPNDIEALTGLGYTYAWSGDYDRAKITFNQALAVAPDHVPARKGVAFADLWAGRAADAESAFLDLSAAQPSDLEAKRGVGLSRLAMGRARSAEQAFLEVLALDPNDLAARNGVDAAQNLPSPLETSLWVGNSAAGNGTGVRAAEIASWVDTKTRVHLRKDDSLSLDNPALARAGLDADALFVGAQHQFGERFIGSVELGRRDLPGGVAQDVYNVQGVFLRDRRVWKLGLQTSPHSQGYDDTLVFGGLNFPVTDRVRMEATLFVSESGARGDDEYRAALSAEFSSPNGWSVGGGLGVGDISSSTPSAAGSVLTANLIASRRVNRSLRLFVQSRWENGPVEDYSTLMAGVTFRRPRR